MTQRLACLVGTVLIIALNAVTIDATTYIAPPADFTEDEKLDFSLSLSDGVVVGDVVGITDSLVKSLWSDELVRDQHFTLRPRRWLKGGATNELLNVAVDPNGSALRRFIPLSGAGSARALVFLRRLPEPPPVPNRFGFWPHAPGIRWQLREGPAEYMNGMLALSSREGGNTELKVVTALNRQSLDSLVWRADLAVLGTVISERYEDRIIGKHLRRCGVVNVERILMGDIVDKEILVSSRFGGVEYGRKILFLRTVGPGVYQPVSFQAGVLRITGNQVDRFERPIGAVAEQIQHAVRWKVQVHDGTRDE